MRRFIVYKGKIVKNSGDILEINQESEAKIGVLQDNVSNDKDFNLENMVNANNSDKIVN